MAIGPAFLLLVAAAFPDSPNLGCSGADNWAASSAYTLLKNSGVLSPESVDFSKTRVELLAQQKIGKGVYRQVHEISFTLKTGSTVRAITTSDASAEECSLGNVKVRVIAQVLGRYP